MSQLVWWSKAKELTPKMSWRERQQKLTKVCVYSMSNHPEHDIIASHTFSNSLSTVSMIEHENHKNDKTSFIMALKVWQLLKFSKITIAGLTFTISKLPILIYFATLISFSFKKLHRYIIWIEKSRNEFHTFNKSNPFKAIQGHTFKVVCSSIDWIELLLRLSMGISGNISRDINLDMNNDDIIFDMMDLQFKLD